MVSARQSIFERRAAVAVWIAGWFGTILESDSGG
jgi:photosystem II stability/assembly factor-like uncharacterized protein